MHSALANVASRKQLRRLGGALELSVDESGSLDELLSLDATTVDAAMLSVLGADGATRARSRLEELRATEIAPPPLPDPARAVASPSQARSKGRQRRLLRGVRAGLAVRIPAARGAPLRVVRAPAALRARDG